MSADFWQALTEHERSRCYQLLYREYLQAGYINPSVSRSYCPSHLARPSTRMFGASRDGHDIGTVSLVVDGRLPSSDVWSIRVAEMRRQCWCAEVSCLVILTGAKTLIGLFSILARTARELGVERLIAVVHPKSVAFYVSRLGFNMVGGWKPIPYVNYEFGALLFLDFERVDRIRPPLYDRIFGRE